MSNERDKIVLARLSALLEDAARAGLGGEECRAVRRAMQRAESGTLTPQEEFFDAREFFSSDIVEALQERTDQIIEAIRFLARPGPDKEERLQRLSRLINTLLGLDLMTFCNLLHVAQVASRASGGPRA